MRLDLGDADFRATLASRLRELSYEIIIDLNLVFHQLPGVYPTTLLKLWHQELQRRGLTPHGAEQCLESDVGEPDEQLPVGHPVDFDWRFTPASVLELVRLALAGASAGEPVAHLGTPTTFLRCALPDAQHQHVLLDRNTAVLDALVSRGVSPPHLIFGIDLHAVRRLHLGAGAAIVDPPWYLDDTLLFLRVAASCAAQMPQWCCVSRLDALDRVLSKSAPCSWTAFQPSASLSMHYGLAACATSRRTSRRSRCGRLPVKRTSRRAGDEETC